VTPARKHLSWISISFVFLACSVHAETISLDSASVAEAPPAVSGVAPRLSVYANGAKEIGVFKGWPIIIKVSVEHPAQGEAAKAAPITLKADQDWTTLLKAEATDQEKRVHAWRVEKALLSKKSPELVLDGQGGAMLAFLVPASETSRIEEGIYELRIRVEGQAKAQGEAVRIKILKHPESLPEKGEIARDRLFAMYYAMKGEKKEALKTVEKIKYSGVQNRALQEAQGSHTVYQTMGSAYVPAGYQPASSGAAEILGLISSFGFGSGGYSSLDDFSPILVGGDTGGRPLPPPAMPPMPGNEDDSLPIETSPVEPPADGEDGAIIAPPIMPVLPAPVIDPALPPVIDPVQPPSDPMPPSGTGQTMLPPRQTGRDYSGYLGMDTTVVVEWSEPVDVDLIVESHFPDTGVIEVKPRTAWADRGPGAEWFRPWDTVGMQEDRILYFSLMLQPTEAGNAVANASITVHIGENAQKMTVVLDESKNQTYWVASRVDIGSFDITPIKEYYTSLSDYLAGGQPVRPPSGETAPSDPLEE
jgi:hypothetical protein